jgi:hypothetical protein
MGTPLGLLELIGNQMRLPQLLAFFRIVGLN